MYEAFNVKFCSWNRLDAENDEFATLLKVGRTSEQAVVKLKLLIATPIGMENYQNVQAITKQEQNISFKTFPLL